MDNMIAFTREGTYSSEEWASRANQLREFRDKFMWRVGPAIATAIENTSYVRYARIKGRFYAFTGTVDGKMIAISCVWPQWEIMLVDGEHRIATAYPKSELVGEALLLCLGWQISDAPLQALSRGSLLHQLWDKCLGYMVAAVGFFMDPLIALDASSHSVDSKQSSAD